ncbi:MAG: hypothetical protein C4295_09235 [Candidatus Fervidibacterota bacterium]
MWLVLPVGLVPNLKPSGLPRMVAILTGGIVAAMVGQWIWIERQGTSPEALAGWFALWGYDPMSPKGWQPLTALFVHTDFQHALVNLTGLWLFGWWAERALGWQKFAVTAMLAHIIALLLQQRAWRLQGLGDLPPLVGASSLVAFAMAICFWRFPHAGVRFRWVRRWQGWSEEFCIPVRWLIGLWVAWQLGATLQQWLTDTLPTPTIAHLTSFLLGTCAAFAWGLQRIAQREKWQAEAKSKEQEGRLKEAAKLWRRLTESEPLNPSLWLSLARTLLKANQIAAARQALQKALTLGHWDEAAVQEARLLLAVASVTLLPKELLFSLAEQMERSRADADALLLFQHLAEVAQFSRAPQALLKVAALYWRLKDKERARQTLHRFWLRYGNTPWRQEAALLAAQLLGRGE